MSVSKSVFFAIFWKNKDNGNHMKPLLEYFSMSVLESILDFLDIFFEDRLKSSSPKSSIFSTGSGTSTRQGSATSATGFVATGITKTGSTTGKQNGKRQKWEKQEIKWGKNGTKNGKNGKTGKNGKHKMGEK